MLTQNQAAKQQAAILVVCPRPRALSWAAPVVPSAERWPATVAPSVVASPALAGVPAGIGSAASARPASGERPAAYGLRRREMTGLGFGTALLAGAGATSSTIAQHKQDQQYLTNRRETRTWRPPH
jgi:hypothetical protein